MTRSYEDELQQNVPMRAGRLRMRADAVQARLGGTDCWTIHHVDTTTSTNDDLVRGSELLRYPPDGTVLITEEQTAGRGRSGRNWSCPRGAGLMFSAKVSAAGIPPHRRAWIGVALGLAIVRALGEVAGVDASLKWPNDVLVDGLKCGGILAESVGDSLVVGSGLNISLDRNELPRADATSLQLAGAPVVDREGLLAAILDEFASLLEFWRQADGNVDASGLRRDYLAACATIGTHVRVELPGGGQITGTAVDVDPDGAIVVDRGNEVLARYSAGDVVHLRPVGRGAGG